MTATVRVKIKNPAEAKRKCPAYLMLIKISLGDIGKNTATLFLKLKESSSPYPSQTAHSTQQNIYAGISSAWDYRIQRK